MTDDSPYLDRPPAWLTDLDNTDGCPVGPRCACCGSDDGERVVVTAGAGPIGVLCLTACASCIAAEHPLPRFPVGSAARMVGEHAEHLGLDLDEVAEALEAEQ